MNKIKRKILFEIVAAAGISMLSGCASTGAGSPTYHSHLTSDMLPVCESAQPLALVAPGEVAEVVPTVAIKPQYPIGALFHGISGVVSLEFTIDEHGLPCDVALLYVAPSSVFVPAAVDALIQSKFKPKTVNGKPISSRTTFTYTFQTPVNGRHSDQELPDSDKSPTRPAYPMAAWLDHVEGFVTFGFTVNAEGHPDNIVVRQSEPAGVFDKAATRALRKSDFKIRYESGQAVPYEATYTYRFRLESQASDKTEQENKEGAHI